MAYNVLQLTPEGEGHVQFSLGNITVELVTRYNYGAGVWSVDILDARGNLLAGGLMLVPGVDLLKPYPDLSASIGGLLVVEAQTDAYLNPDNLGSTVQLLWFAPGEDVVFP